MGIILPRPNEKIKATLKNPRITLFYSEPKVGKTSLLATLPDSLLIDLENGSDYVDATKVKVNSLEELTEVGKQIIKDDFPYKYGIVDTVTMLDEWCDNDATELYKRSVIGKNFKGDYVTAELPQGAGYYWLRKSFGIYFNCLASWFPTLIVVAHVRDKMLVDKKGNQVEAIDLDLTGKLRQITCAKADAIGYLHRKTIGAGEKGTKEQAIFCSFRSEGITTGSRSRHLEGKDIELSKIVGEDEEIKANWDKIFLKEN